MQNNDNLILSVVVAGRWSDKPCLVVSPIKGYTKLEGDAKKGFLSENPVIYEELDGRNFSADIKDIVYVDYSKSKGNIGNSYRVPREYVKAIA